MSCSRVIAQGVEPVGENLLIIGLEPRRRYVYSRDKRDGAHEEKWREEKKTDDDEGNASSRPSLNYHGYSLLYNYKFIFFLSEIFRFI